MTREVIRRTLQNYVKNLNEGQQWRFNEALQNELISVLENGKVYAKVMELRNEQHKTESSLNEKRTDLLRKCQGDPQLEDKLLANDSGIVQVLDEIIGQQQAALRALNVPAFRITTSNHEIELQMLILDFIATLECDFSVYK